MIRRLTLIRHAKSSWSEPGLGDFDRSLNPRGLRDAPEIGRRLAGAGFSCQRLISSPAQRARQTAVSISAEIGLAEEEIIYQDDLYLASLATLIDLIRAQPDGLTRLALCGHNPGLTELADWLSANGPDNLPTAAIFSVDLDLDSWADLEPCAARIDGYDYPKKQ